MSDRKAVLLLMFDLPSATSEDRREYYHFRKKLKLSGFLPLQESCYMKLLRNVSSVEPTLNTMKKMMPKAGNVSILPLQMNVFRGMQFPLGESFNMSLFTDDVFEVGSLETSYEKSRG